MKVSKSTQKSSLALLTSAASDPVYRDLSFMGQTDWLLHPHMCILEMTYCNDEMDPPI